MGHPARRAALSSSARAYALGYDVEMTGGDWWLSFWYWPWRDWVVSSLLIVSGLIVLVWAVVGDRARGRRRCPKCWYDLRGTVGRRCSECGFEAQSEGRLFRSRRRWRWATVAGLAVAMGIGIAATPRVHWLGLMPNWVLLRIAPHVGDENWAFTSASTYYHPTITELIDRDVAMSLDGDDWTRELARAGVIRTRRVWPAGEPLVIAIEKPAWADRSDWEIHLAADDQKKAILEDPGGDPSDSPQFYYLQLGVPSGGNEFVELTCITRTSAKPSYRLKDKTASPDTPVDPIRIEKATIRIPLTIAPTGVAVQQLASNSQIDALMKSVIRVRLFLEQDEKRLTISLRYERSAAPELADVAYGFVVEVLRDDHVVETIDVPVLPGCAAFEDIGSARRLAADSLRFIESWSDEERRHWSLRVRGDARMALRDWDRGHYWGGEFVVPLEEVIPPSLQKPK